MMRSCLLTLLLLMCCAPAWAQKKPNPVFAPIEDVENLPRVLLIGDSISIGYTLAVRDELRGIANVHRIPTNGGPTTNGLKQLDKWLGDKPWDVIHFNWGLHDLKYMNEKGTLVPVSEGKQQVPPADYEKNLEELVTRLQKTGAKLIWCQTTPVPEGATGRIRGDEVTYNEIATRVMNRHNIAIDDLYTVANKQLNEIQRKADVHFTAAGSEVLAKHVAAEIKKQLN
ncbi:MAG: SGNH/GDSL hydrolase family protein [Planctomycetaceae bacterium]|nr:SGNH/GDSL hydrolase family protein [Planctomycetaceae bacterium]